MLTDAANPYTPLPGTNRQVTVPAGTYWFGLMFPMTFDGFDPKGVFSDPNTWMTIARSCIPDRPAGLDSPDPLVQLAASTDPTRGAFAGVIPGTDTWIVFWITRTGYIGLIPGNYPLDRVPSTRLANRVTFTEPTVCGTEDSEEDGVLLLHVGDVTMRLLNREETPEERFVSVTSMYYDPECDGGCGQVAFDFCDTCGAESCGDPDCFPLDEHSCEPDEDDE